MIVYYQLNFEKWKRKNGHLTDFKVYDYFELETHFEHIMIYLNI